MSRGITFVRDCTGQGKRVSSWAGRNASLIERKHARCCRVCPLDKSHGNWELVAGYLNAVFATRPFACPPTELQNTGQDSDWLDGDGKWSRAIRRRPRNAHLSSLRSLKPTIVVTTSSVA